MAIAGAGQANLYWSGSTGATSYKVKRSTTSGGSYTQIATPASTSYTDSAVTNGTTYYYVVSAVGAGGESATHFPGQRRPAVAATPAPATPANFAAIAGNAQVSLSWSASSGSTGYKVKRSTTSGGSYTQIATPASTSYTDSAVTNGTTYYYVVSAVGAGGESANTSQANVTPKAPVTLPPVGNCDHLPATGTWENITPPGHSTKPAVNGTVGAAIIVDPFNPERIWLGTGSENEDNLALRRLRRIVDESEHWSRQ